MSVISAIKNILAPTPVSFGSFGNKEFTQSWVLQKVNASSARGLKNALKAISSFKSLKFEINCNGSIVVQLSLNACSKKLNAECIRLLQKAMKSPSLGPR